jgi:hypothetical protein
MKSLARISTWMLIAAVAIAACTKPKAKTTSAHYLSMSSPSVGAFYSGGTSVQASGATGAKIVIEGESVGGSRVLIYINPYNAVVGPYAVSGTMIGGAYHSAAEDTIISAVHGTITLTAVSPDIIGTYSYTGSDSSVFTGSFNVPAP